jgi:hypothetical protein
MGLDLTKSKDMDEIMKSVQPGMPWTQTRLANLGSELQNRFQCLLKARMIGKRENNERRRNGQ